MAQRTGGLHSNQLSIHVLSAWPNVSSLSRLRTHPLMVEGVEGAVCAEVPAIEARWWSVSLRTNGGVRQVDRWMLASCSGTTCSPRLLSQGLRRALKAASAYLSCSCRGVGPLKTVLVLRSSWAAKLDSFTHHCSPARPRSQLSSSWFLVA